MAWKGGSSGPAKRAQQALRRLVGEAAAGLVHEDGAQGDERRAQHELPRRGEEGRHQEAREPPRRRARLAPEAEAVAWPAPRRSPRTDTPRTAPGSSRTSRSATVVLRTLMCE